MQDIAEDAVTDQVPDIGNTRGTAEGEADPGNAGGVAGCLGHGAGVCQGVAQRLFAQHVLAGGEQAFHHFAVERVGDDHADDVDIIGFGDCLP